MDGARQALRQAGYADPQILSELFGGAEGLRPGIIGKSNAAPHMPPGPEGDGPVISFVRSGLSVRWSSRYKNLLDLAEACDVPVRWSCRSGVCHTCETGLVGGRVHNSPTPLQPPADGVVLICCSQPDEDVQLDL
jgi:ferredoxin